MEHKLSSEEIHRYSRHLVLPEVGLDGQEKLKAAKVLLIGSGGLGSPLGLSLAAAGISEGLVRLSVGLEDIDDLRDDLASALKASQQG